MTWRRRGVVLAVLLVVAYTLALVAADVYVARSVRAAITRRLEATFGGTVAIGSVDVRLWRGTAEARDITIERGSDGVAIGAMASVSATFARGGAVLWTREFHEFRLRDGRLSLSLAALRALKRPRDARVWSRRVVVERLTISIAPSARLPGVLASELTLARVVSGRTQLRSLISWLESVQEVDGRLVVPLLGDLAIRLHGQRLGLRGSLVPRDLAIAYAPPRLPASATDGQRVKSIVSHVLGGVAEQLGSEWGLQALINLPSKW